jgi:hypothetical protein
VQAAVINAGRSSAVTNHKHSLAAILEDKPFLRRMLMKMVLPFARTSLRVMSVDYSEKSSDPSPLSVIDYQVYPLNRR